MKEQSTIRDVAKLAGVSVATVSRVLSDSSYPVGVQTRQKVTEAAKALNYTPNILAKTLRASGSKDIGVVVPNMTNPFYMHAILGISEVLTEEGYNLILCNTMHDEHREEMCLQQLVQRRVEGIIISSVGKKASSISKYHKMGIRFVLLDQKVDEVDCPSIYYDSCGGTEMAVKYLLEKGHSTIAFASTPITRWTRVEMLRGYKSALRKQGISYDEDLVFICPDKIASDRDGEVSAGRVIVEEFVNRASPATAIVCVNDMIAIGVIQAFLKRGIRVPEDVSVVGFDDIPFAEAYMPALTTVRYPATETGRLAALVLLDSKMNDAIGMPLTMSLSPQLVVRDTVAERK